MALKSIMDFSAEWQLMSHQGVITLKRADGGKYDIRLQDQSRFDDVVEALTQARPIQFDTKTLTIRAGQQVIFQK